MDKKQNKFATSALVVTLLAFGSSAYAELPAAATAALNNVSTGITDAETAAWPLIGAALVAGLVIKLVKRFANKI